MKKVFKCCICHKVLEEYKPIRLVKQKFYNPMGVYGQYKHICNYDFCIDCYKRFNAWIRKHSEES